MSRSTQARSFFTIAALSLGLAMACGGGNDVVLPSPVVPSAPVVASFLPTSGPVGTSVTITGSNFTGATAVSFGATPAPVLHVNSDTQISATVPTGAANGASAISVTTSGGTAHSASSFTVVASAQPAITDFNPKQGGVGAFVTLTGAGFSGATAVKFNGTAAAFSVLSDASISATVPAGASTGPLSVTNGGSTGTSTGTSTGSFTVSGGTTSLDLALLAVALNQGVQTLAGDVPLVANRDGHLRVFVQANQANSAAPVVRVTLDGVATDIPAPSGVTSAGVPTSVSEADFTKSWELDIPGASMKNGMVLKVEVDPGHTVPETNLSNNVLSATKTVKSVSIFKTTLVPILQTGQTVAGNVQTGRTLADWVDRFQRMYPIQNAGVDVTSHATLQVSVTLAADGTGWSQCLKELDAARLSEATGRYYYGALNVDYDSGQAGLGQMPGHSAIGWDREKPNAAGYVYKDGGHFPEIFAHEVGHNLDCDHAPCGITGATDTNWPSDTAHAGALIGAWGWDHNYTAAFPDSKTPFRDPATYKDIMSYCTPLWVSDYTYKNVLAYRATLPDVVETTAADAVAQECLLITGSVKGGQVLLDPMLQVFTVPQPPKAGAYTLQLHDAAGSALVEVPFSTTQVEDLPTGSEQHFVFTIPVAENLAKSFQGVRVLEQGQLRAARVAAGMASGSVKAQTIVREPVALRMGPGRAHVGWDAAVQPRVMVRDPRSGEVIAFAEGGYLDLPTDASELEVTFSDGVRSSRRVLKVQE